MRPSPSRAEPRDILQGVFRGCRFSRQRASSKKPIGSPSLLPETDEAKIQEEGWIQPLIVCDRRGLFIRRCQYGSASWPSRRLPAGQRIAATSPSTNRRWQSFPHAKSALPAWRVALNPGHPSQGRRIPAGCPRQQFARIFFLAQLGDRCSELRSVGRTAALLGKQRERLRRTSDPAHPTPKGHRQR